MIKDKTTQALELELKQRKAAAEIKRKQVLLQDFEARVAGRSFMVLRKYRPTEPAAYCFKVSSKVSLRDNFATGGKEDGDPEVTIKVKSLFVFLPTRPRGYMHRRVEIYNEQLEHHASVDKLLDDGKVVEISNAEFNKLYRGFTGMTEALFARIAKVPIEEINPRVNKDDDRLKKRASVDLINVVIPTGGISHALRGIPYLLADNQTYLVTPDSVKQFEKVLHELEDKCNASMPYGDPEGIDSGYFRREERIQTKMHILLAGMQRRLEVRANEG